MKADVASYVVWGGLVVFSFASAAFGVRLVRRVCLRRGWFVPPREDRWHSRPTALHGGVGFFPPMALAFAALWLHCSFTRGWSDPESPALVLGLLGGCLLVFVLGLFDDLRQIRPAAKLAFQCVAATIFILAGGVLPVTGYSPLDVALTYLWITGITNAFNLLDNMDGLSSGVGAIAGVGVCVLSTTSGAATLPVAGPLAAVFVAAVLGFWVHNRHPAKIFMGDSGSLVIGYFLACVSIPSPINGFLGVPGAGGSIARFAFLVPMALLLVPIFDTCLVTVTRLARGRRITQGGRDHVSHRLVLLGFSDSSAVRLLCCAAWLCCLAATLLPRSPDVALLLLGLLFVSGLVGSVYLASVPVGGGGVARVAVHRRENRGGPGTLDGPRENVPDRPGEAVGHVAR